MTDLSIDRNGIFLKHFHSFMWIIKQWSKMGFIIVIYSVIIVLFSFAGLVYEIKNNPSIDSYRLSQTVMLYVVFSIAIHKFVTVIKKADQILKLLDIVYTDFSFKLQGLLNNENILMFQKANIRIFHFWVYSTCMTIFLWIIFPIYYNSTMPNNDLDNFSGICVINFYYPISDHIYNTYFYLIYIIEATFIILITFYALVFDVFFFSLCLAIIIQYKVITSGLTTFGHDGIKKGDKMYEDLITRISHCQKVHLQMRKFCPIIRLSVFLQVASCSVALITCSYNIAVILVTHPVDTINLLRNLITYICLAVHLFSYLYYLDLVNVERDGLNFGLYSCDWTAMDIRFKKLLLLAMVINNADQLKIRASPTKVIDLKLFLDVLKTSYSVASVMLNVKLATTNEN